MVPFPPVGSTSADANPNQRTRWGISLLPHLELANVKGQYNHKLSETAPEDVRVLQTFVKPYLCPTDINTDKLEMPPSGPFASAATFSSLGLPNGIAPAWVCYARVSAQPPAAEKLPGARLSINAAAYSSLQAAINALPENGGAVRLPAGRFEISEPLVLETQDALLTGEWTATEIVNANTSGRPAIIIRSRSHAIGPRSYVWRVQLSNLRLIGNEKSSHGIEAQRVNEIFINGVTVSYHGGDGIHLRGCYEDARIANSMISYNRGTGVAIVACHDIVVAANQLEENQDGLRCLDSFNLCMTDNNVDDHLRHGVVSRGADRRLRIRKLKRLYGSGGKSTVVGESC
jgi:hypothetical protein